MLVGVYDRFTAGDRDGAAELFDAYMPFTRYEPQPGYGLAVRNEILRRRGGIRSARARWPAPDLGREGIAGVDADRKRVGWGQSGSDSVELVGTLVCKKKN